MRKITLIVLSAALLFSQQVFADAACGMVAKACVAAGYSRDENTNKKFWQDCMKPLLYGKTVVGVTVEPATVKACRVTKISELQKELQDLQNVAQKN